MSRSFWNKTAKKYAKSPVGGQKAYENKLAQTQSVFDPSMRVLEFGCGTGSTAIEHAPHVAHIDAIDISDAMIEIATNKAMDASVKNIRFTRATLEEYGAQDSSYDAVLGLNILHLIQDRVETIAQCARIVKPGGVFVTSTVCLARSKLRFITLIAPLARWLGLMPNLYVFSEEQLVQEMIDAGFSIERQWHHAKDDIAVFVIARKL